MKYATWNVYFPEGSNEGSTADQEITARGGKAFGLISLDNSTFSILGQFDDDADISNLDKWSFQEITEEQAVKLLQDKADKTPITKPLII
jgi:hypothetical protein